METKKLKKMKKRKQRKSKVVMDPNLSAEEKAEFVMKEKMPEPMDIK